MRSLSSARFGRQSRHIRATFGPPSIRVHQLNSSPPPHRVRSSHYPGPRPRQHEARNRAASEVGRTQHLQLGERKMTLRYVDHALGKTSLFALKRMLALVGRCPRCLRSSFWFMLAGWTTSTALAIFEENVLFFAFMVVSAAGTLVWLSHIVVASRSASARQVLANRRVAIASTVKVLGTLLLISALPSRALAAASCSDCEEWRRSCFAKCPADIFERPHCLRDCMKEYRCISGRDCK